MMKIAPSRDLAATLLRLRRLRRVSLEELAEASGVSPGTLSGIESGVGNPRLGTLVAVAEALYVSVDELVRPWDPRVHIVRGDEMERRHRFGLTNLVASQIRAADRHLELSLMRVWKPEGSLGGEGAVDHVLVLAGGVTVEFEEEKVTLRPGDYIRFDADVAHKYLATGLMAQAVLLRERRG